LCTIDSINNLVKHGTVF